MVALGVVLAAEGPGRGALYRVAREAAEQTARRYARDANAENAIPVAHIGGVPGWLLECAAILRTYFTTHPSLKNADYREMFDLDRDAARRELRRLVQEGFLRLEGERRGARYMLGPALPGTVKEEGVG